MVGIGVAGACRLEVEGTALNRRRREFMLLGIMVRKREKTEALCTCDTEEESQEAGIIHKSRGTTSGRYPENN
jgi:hypothetical protein